MGDEEVCRDKVLKGGREYGQCGGGLIKKVAHLPAFLPPLRREKQAAVEQVMKKNPSQPARLGQPPPPTQTAAIGERAADRVRTKGEGKPVSGKISTGKEGGGWDKMAKTK